MKLEEFKNKLELLNQISISKSKSDYTAPVNRANTSQQNSNIFEDIGANFKNVGIGIKQGGLNFTNYMAKVGDFVSDKVFNREEQTIKTLNDDLKQYGIDGSKLSIQEKINKLIEVDPLSMDKYNSLLVSKGLTLDGDNIFSKTHNAVSMATGGFDLFNPYKQMVNGTTLTENDKGENVIDSWSGKRDENNIDNRITELQEEANKNTENVSNPILKYTAGLAPSIGNNATSMAISAVNPLASTLYFTGSAANSYALDGKGLGLSDDASLIYGTLLGVIDGQLEKIGLENFKKGTKDMLKGNVREAIKKYAIDIADNYIQEALMEPAQEIANQLFTGKSNWNGMLGRMNEAGMSGAVSSAILGGTTGAVTKGINTVNNIKVNNQVKTEIINKIDRTNLLENNVKDTLKKAVGRLNGKSLYTLNQNLSILDEVKQGVDKTNIDDFIEKRLNNLRNGNQASQNVNIDSKKQMARQTFFDSAKTNNIDVNNNTEVLDSMFEMAYQRGVNIRIDGKVFTNENQDALWRVNKETGKREIVINPNNPTKALQNITIHEMVHDMENTKNYEPLSDLILDYAKSQDNYDNARKELSDMYAEEYKNYKGTEFESRINQEMVANILGEKLGNQEFVNSIVTSNRGVAQNIYSWVVDKLNKVNKLTGYKFEKLYWADVKNKFEKAFSSEFNNIEGGTKYSIQNDTNGNKYIKVDTDQDIFEGIAPKDYGKIAKMYMQDYLMGETKLSDNDTAVIDKKGINKYTNPGKFQFNFNEKMKLTPELKNALNISEKVNAKAPIKSNSKYSNWEYYNFNFEINGNKFSGLINIGIDSNNNKHFYEINNIKRIGVSETSLKESTNPFINNIIPQNQQNINGNIKNDVSTKDNKGRQLSQQQQEKYKNVSEKLKNENGELKTYYHGTQRADRVGNVFDPKKATSGPMAFFTDNQEIAESYSKNKQDTSISREVETEYDLFKIDGKSLDDYWKSLTKEQQSRIAEEGYNIGLDDNFENIVHEENASKNSFSNQYDYYLRYEEKGNAIKALYDVFIQDGNLMFEDMHKFQDVLKYAVIGDITYLDQYKTDSKVYEVYLNVTNPFDTSEITQEIINELEEVARKTPLLQAYNADQWDKTNIKPSDWINRLKEDYKNGTAHAWTSIPDFVTNYLKSKGYDGIVDVGGKNGGEVHQVVIPFYSNQIKNVDNVNPTSSDDIRYSKSSNNEYQNFIQDNFSNDGTKTYMKDIKKAPASSDFKNFSNIVEKLSYTFDEAINNKQSKKRITLGIINEKASRIVKSILGIDVKNRKHILSENNIRHLINQHSDAVNEAKKGQIPITKEDVLRIPDIIENFDNIIKGNPNENGETLRYIKNYDDGTTYLVEVVPENSNVLDIKTMWKKPTSLVNVQQNSNLTSETEPSITSSTINNIIPLGQNYVNNTKKTMNPIEIANLNKESVSSTPDIEFTKPIANGNKKSSFYKNITNNSKFLNKELRSALKTDADVEYYKGITNEETLTKAMKKLDDGGEVEAVRWANKDKDFTPEDVTEGWILLKRYQDVGNYKGAIQIARKMRNIATNAGQTVQAFGIMNRLTPEGMTMYAQKELDEAFEKFSENKTKKWIDENEAKFQLKPDETQFIVDKVKEAQGYEKNSYEQKVALAEIQKLMTDKLPPERGQKIKSWMRISMLFNPKTQVRNVAGNAIIAPVNYAGDIVSSIVDKSISKKTGVRTIGTANVKAILKGLKKGASEATNDFRKGINTKSIDGNRFEISHGKSFSENNIIGKSLNRVEATLNYVMDVGDRVFSESWFENSLQNQMVLNNATEVTQEMIDIATQEALSRTWNDNNDYTEFVLNIRKKMNKLNIGGYGIGDILIPFAKTPANLTKAIVDYSPVGLVNSLKEGINLKNSIEKGTNIAIQQHQFVQNLGKAVAGTLLYIAGYALAKAGITTGDNDDDKDVANFMKNTLGVSSYSIKIGDKTFTYDWAQPISAPLSIMADIVKLEDSDAELYDKVLDVIDTPLNNIMEQSFMSSIQSVLNNRDNVTKGIAEAIEELPSRAIPTFVKQVADLVDGTQRQTYVKGKPIETAINKVKVKIPIVSKKLAPTVDTLGRESKKFGGNNGVFNVFFNPANFNTGLTTKSAEEIYKLYKQTGDKTIMPRVAGYSLTYKGKNYNLSTEERAKYQKVMGKYVNDNVEKLLSSKDYKKLSNIQKADIINEIVSDGAELAKEDYANTYNKKNSKNKIEYERSKSDIKVDEEIKKGLSTANAYIYKTIISQKESDKDADDKAISNSSTKNKLKYIMDMEIDDSQKQHLINVSTNDTDYDVSVKDLKKLNGEYLTYLQQSGKQPEKGGMTAREEYMQLINSGIPVKQLNKYYSEKGDIEGVKDSSGKTISGSKKQAIFNYVNSLSLNIPQKQILLARENESFAKLYYNDIINYINNLNISNTGKSKMYDAIFKKIK